MELTKLNVIYMKLNVIYMELNVIYMELNVIYMELNVIYMELNVIYMELMSRVETKRVLNESRAPFTLRSPRSAAVLYFNDNTSRRSMIYNNI